MDHRIRRRVLAAAVALTASVALPFSTAHAQAASKPKVAPQEVPQYRSLPPLSR